LISQCVTTGTGRRYDPETETLVAHSLRAEGYDASEDGTGRGTPLVPVAFGWQNSASQGLSDSTTTVPTLDKSKTPGVASGSAVRRLTPRECERLQGFPDDYTLIPYRRGTAADGPRYKALGNSMAVPVMRWIGERIVAVENLCE
jgi:DNA (cytosine-5)-methyltransferase 1